MKFGQNGLIAWTPSFGRDDFTRLVLLLQIPDIVNIEVINRRLFLLCKFQQRCYGIAEPGTARPAKKDNSIFNLQYILFGRIDNACIIRNLYRYFIGLIQAF